MVSGRHETSDLMTFEELNSINSEGERKIVLHVEPSDENVTLTDTLTCERP